MSYSFAKTFNHNNNIKTNIKLSNWKHTIYENNITLIPTNDSANVYITNDLIIGGSLNNPSDIKLKENIKPIDPEYINNIMKINPKQYNYKNDVNKKIHYGIIAQDLEELMPELVSNFKINENEKENEKENEFKMINYLELIPLLIIKIQELENKINKIMKNVSVL